MSAKMQRRRRHDRRKRILTERREDQVFFARGTFPASATTFAVCPCGARAFARGRDDSFADDFDAAHQGCEVAS